MSRTARRAPSRAPAGGPGGRRAPLPDLVPPQLATPVARPPAGDAWLHEMKFDGYRILARLDGGRVRLLSRTGGDWTARFPSVAGGVARLPAGQALLDGEVAVLMPDGTTSFEALQNTLSGRARGRLAYMVFDLLHLDGHDLTKIPLEDRKALLARLLEAAGPEAEPLRYSDHVVGAGPEFFARACRLGVEGVVSKRRGAPYRGLRSRDWLKAKCTREQEVVIGGYTDPAGSRAGIGALLAGVHEDGRLVYAGRVGTGFTDRTLRDLRARLRPLEQAACPFTPPPTGLGTPHWVVPSLVARVAFTEWTGDGKLRHPSFRGLREDKPAGEVVREVEAPGGGPEGPASAGRRRAPRRPPAPAGGPRSRRGPASGRRRRRGSA